MRLFNYVLLLPAILWIGLYTVGFGRWCLKQGNIAGAAAVFMLASAATVIPVYMLFFRF